MSEFDDLTPDPRRDQMRLKAAAVFTAALIFAMAPFATGGFAGFEPSLFPVPQDDPPVQPAGYAFAIWGLIYLGLVVHGVMGLFARADRADWDRGRWALTGSLVLGAAWIPVAQFSVPWATVLIWLMWAGAVVALMRAPSETWVARVPLGLYAGWLTAASSVSIGLVLAGYGVMDAVTAALIALLLALGLAWVIQGRVGTPAYGAAVIWALVGVVVANAASGSMLVLVLAALGAGAIAWRIFQGLRA